MSHRLGRHRTVFVVAACVWHNTPGGWTSAAQPGWRQGDAGRLGITSLLPMAVGDKVTSGDHGICWLFGLSSRNLSSVKNITNSYGRQTHKDLRHVYSY